MPTPESSDPAEQARLPALRAAIAGHRFVTLRYRDLNDIVVERRVRPLEVVRWSGLWTLAGWCEQRGAFRRYRIDRIDTMQVEDVGFEDQPGRTLADLREMESLEMAERDTATDA